MNKKIAELLLQIKAVELNPLNPFTWASGIKSPIYCDNRLTLAFPEVRNYIRDSYIETIKKNFHEVNQIAAVATGAIAQGAMIADKMNLPMVYVRSKPKDHGKQKLIEGKLLPNAKVVIIEDLISTGGSSLAAFEALKNENVEILGMVAIFTYNLPIAKNNFEQAKCTLLTLTNFDELIETAVEHNYILTEQIQMLKDWQKSM